MAPLPARMAGVLEGLAAPPPAAENCAAIFAAIAAYFYESERTLRRRRRLRAGMQTRLTAAAAASLADFPSSTFETLEGPSSAGSPVWSHLRLDMGAVRSGYHRSPWLNKKAQKI